MPYTIQRYQDLPVFVVTFSGAVTLEEFQQVDFELATLSATFSGNKIYIIEEIRQATTGFATIMNFFKQSRLVDSGITQVERQSIFVGHNIISTMIEQLSKTAGKIPHFPDLESAIEYVQYDMD